MKPRRLNSNFLRQFNLTHHMSTPRRNSTNNPIHTVHSPARHSLGARESNSFKLERGRERERLHRCVACRTTHFPPNALFLMAIYAAGEGERWRTRVRFGGIDSFSSSGPVWICVYCRCLAGRWTGFVGGYVSATSCPAAYIGSSVISSL